jgi:hypothetical protein
MIADCRLRIADCLLPACGLAAALVLFALLCSGCGQSEARTPIAGQPPKREIKQAGSGEEAKPVELPPPVVPTGFGPARICILPLTELPTSTDSSQAVLLNAYLVLLDAFGCQIKAPGVLRFELYQHVPRSAEPRGQRLAIWPDIDLTHPAANNKYWRDFLRAYEFILDVPAGLNETYVLEATCMCPDGRRLTATFPLRGAK